MNLQEKDRIGQYLIPLLNEIVFDELSENYLKKVGVDDILTDVPVPLRKSELKNITLLGIGRAMAYVIGCDPTFKHKDNYIAFIKRMFNEMFAEGLIADGVEASEKKDYDYACVQFRAAFMISPDNAKAYYAYGRACKDAYDLAEDEEFIGRFKAEALEAFEVATMKDPEFAESFYYLGYAYLNMGLYVKAKLTWEDYIKLLNKQDSDLVTRLGKAVNDEEKNSMEGILREHAELNREVSERLMQLREPVRIEEGYNLIVSGKFEQGLKILEEFKEGKTKDWWPLWYYMGTAQAELGNTEEAVESYLKVLKLSPSNQEVMEELVKLYRELGDSEKVEKYERKIEVVKANQEADRVLREEADARGESLAPKIGPDEAIVDLPSDPVLN